LYSVQYFRLIDRKNLFVFCSVLQADRQEESLCILFSTSGWSSAAPRASKAFWLRFSGLTQNTADLVEAWHQLARDLSGQLNHLWVFSAYSEQDFFFSVSDPHSFDTVPDSDPAF
jgi:hypothetical protein